MSTSIAEAGPSTAHEMRITNHGKIGGWVSFALEHLKKYEERPLVLHTLPRSKSQAPVTAQDNPQPTSSASEKNLHPSLLTIPRLVSVVEIIKREYLKTLDPKLAASGSLSGLHQYNEVGDLEEAGYIEDSRDREEGRMESLAHALQGRNHLLQKKIVFMRVTLSRKEIPELMRRDATYQKPAVRKLSRSTRARMRKKLKKTAEGSENIS